MIKRKIQISTFVMLAAFITTIAISCSNNSTEPQISASLNTEESAEYVVDISSLLGKTFRSEETQSDLFYIYVKITDAGKILYKIGNKTEVNSVTFDSQTEMSLSEGIKGDNMISYQFEGKPITTTKESQKGTLQVKPNAVSITFTEGNSYLNTTFNLIEIEGAANTPSTEQPAEDDLIKNNIGKTYESISRYSFAGYGTFKYTVKLTEYETGKYRLELTGGQYDNRKPIRDKTKDKSDGSKAFYDWETHFIKFSEDGNTLYFTPNTWVRPIEMKRIQ